MSEEEIEEYWPVAFPLFQSIERLKLFTTRLRTVKSEEDWAILLHDVDDRSDGEALTHEME